MTIETKNSFSIEYWPGDFTNPQSGWDIVQEGDIINSVPYRTKREAQLALKAIRLERAINEGNERHNAALYAHACGYHD